MPRLRLTAESSAPPDRVLAAAGDFSDRRPELWPNIDSYEVHELGDDFADVTEGTNFLGNSWARERYEWSQPGVVRATTTDSNIFKEGSSWQLTATPRNGGSHVEVITDRTVKGLKGNVVGVAMRLGKGELRKHLEQFLRTVEGETSS